MPSLELTELLEEYDEYNDALDFDPSGRVQVIEKMWELRDPEAIPALAIIYEEDMDASVRSKAEEVLKRFRALQHELERDAGFDDDEMPQQTRKGSGVGLRRLRTFLTLSLLVLVALNAVVFVSGSSSGDGDDTENTQTNSVSNAVPESVNQIAATLDATINDADVLMQNLIQLQQGTATTTVLCPITQFSRPALVVVPPDASVELVNLINNDINFSIGGVQGVTGYWDLICAGTPPGDLAGNISRLQIALDVARSARSHPLVASVQSVPLTQEAERRLLINRLLTNINITINDARGLQEELRKIEQGDLGALNCQRLFIRPEPIPLSQSQIAQYPDIHGFVGGFEFSRNELQAAFDFWGVACDPTGIGVQASQATENIARLQTVIDERTSARDTVLINLITSPVILPPPSNSQ